MISNNTFLETRIQRLLDGLIFVEKGLCVHVQPMLKMSRGLYTGGNFKENTWKKENWGPYLRSWFDKDAQAIRRTFSLVDMITKAKFSNSPNYFKIRLFGYYNV